MKCPVDQNNDLGACTTAGWSTTPANAPRGLDYSVRSDSVAQIAIGVPGGLQLCTVSAATGDATCTQNTISGASAETWDVLVAP